jgi:predicted amino acid-binding ACT domain protein
METQKRRRDRNALAQSMRDSACILALAIIGFPVWSQGVVAETDSLQQLQERLAEAQREVHDLESPVFKNFREIGFDCTSLNRDYQRDLEELESKMKARIREAGLKVLDQKKEDLRDVSRPYFSIQIDPFAHAGGIEVIAQLTEQVMLKRNPKEPLILPTWSRRECLVKKGGHSAESQVEPTVQKFVDEFVAQYIASSVKAKHEKASSTKQ